MSLNNNSSMNNEAKRAFDKACNYGMALVASAISIGISSITAPPLVTAAFAMVTAASAVGLFNSLKSAREIVTQKLSVT